MPFVSQAQRNKFYATAALHKYIPEYEAATGNRKLPVRVMPKKKRVKRHRQRTVAHYTAVTHALAGLSGQPR